AGLSITDLNGGTILVREGLGSLIVDSLVTSASQGAITLFSDADDSTDELRLNANVTNTNASGGDIRLVSFGDVNFNAATVAIDSKGGDIDVHAGQGLDFLTLTPDGVFSPDADVTGQDGYVLT